MSQVVTPPARHTLEALLLAVAFALAHTQSPLYYSNQNQYLLHGAALAHHGHLAHDWLANTRDPTPLFSALVAVAYATTEPWALQLAYFVLLMGYFLAARWMVAAIPGFPDTRAGRVSFAALFIAAHAAILRWVSVQLTGVDYPWYLQAGLAAQYLLGTGIQPSAFGVLLLVAVATFAHGRPLLACVLAAGVCWFHSTYLLPSALLVLGFLTELLREGRIRVGLLAGVGALVVVSPVVIFTVWEFDPFDPHATHALHILAHIRIPHHCVPSRWFDWVAALQLGWMALGLILIRRLGFGRALVVAAIGGGMLTAIQVVSGSDSLALAFPWRISVLLVPVATTVVIAKLLAWKPPIRWTEWCAIASLFALVAGGVAVTAFGLGYRTVDEHELYDYIRTTAKSEDVYLLPVQLPKVGSGRGAVSNTFKPPPLAKEGNNQIPVDLQQFRLVTGECVYVDFKSVPYAPAEVEEWYRRMEFASSLANRHEWDSPEIHASLKREGITHVIWPRSKPLSVSYLKEQHTGKAYIVYKVE